MAFTPPALTQSNRNKRSKGSETTFFQEAKEMIRLGSVPEKTVIDFTRGFAVMLKARLSITQALEIALQRTKDTKLRDVLQNVLKDVKGGKSLAMSMSAYPKVFDSLYIHLVEVGELSGVLDKVLLRLADYKSKRFTFKKKVKMALVYPGMVLGVAAGAILFLLLVIVPTFAEMYRDFDAELPELTMWVLSASQWISAYFWVVVMGVTAMGFGGYKLLENPSVRYKFDQVKLNIPFWGSIILNNIIVRFCQTLGTLLKSGIALVEALTIMAQSTTNLIVKNALQDVVRVVKKGGSLGGALKKNQVFPPIVLQMISVGEETAELDKMLFHLSDHFQAEVDIRVDTITSVIEPVLIVVLGIILGFLIIAMYLPMFELMNVMG